jgi:hypothetical protein
MKDKRIMLKDIRKTLFRFFSPFFKLGTGYRKFWYVAIFSILLLSTPGISKNDYCAKTMDNQLSCQVSNGITGFASALLTASLVAIFTRAAEIWSTQDKKIAFDDFFGFDSYSINNKNDVAIVIPDFPLKSLDSVINHILKNPNFHSENYFPKEFLINHIILQIQAFPMSFLTEITTSLYEAYRDNNDLFKTIRSNIDKIMDNENIDKSKLKNLIKYLLSSNHITNKDRNENVDVDDIMDEIQYIIETPNCKLSDLISKIFENIKYSKNISEHTYAKKIREAYIKKIIRITFKSYPNININDTIDKAMTIFKIDKNMLKEDETDKYAKYLAHKIKHSDLEQNTGKKLSEPNFTATLDIKSLSYITSLLAAKEYIIDKIHTDDIDISEIEKYQYKSLIILGLLSNKLVSHFQTNNDLNRLFTLDTTNKKIIININSSPGKKLSYQDHSDNGTNIFWGLICKTKINEKQVTIFGGISSEGTLETAKFLKEDWEKVSERLTKKIEKNNLELSNVKCVIMIKITQRNQDVVTHSIDDNDIYLI